MKSIVDVHVLLEIGDAFELQKQHQEATTNTSTLVNGRTLFAAQKTEEVVVEVRTSSPFFFFVVFK